MPQDDYRYQTRSRGPPDQQDLPSTRPRAENSTASQQSADERSRSNVAQDNTVTLCWLFFDKSAPSQPIASEIPSHLWSGRAQNSLDFFIKELERYCKFNAQATTVRFWKPRNPIPIGDATSEEWTKDIGKVQDIAEPVFAVRSFSKVLHLDDDEHVHLIITAKGSYINVHGGPGEEHDEARDVIVPLPENRRYEEVLSDRGTAPHEGAKSSSYQNTQKKPQLTIYDGRYAEGGPPTIAPPIQIFHPVFERFFRYLDDPSNLPSPEDLVNAQKLMNRLSKIDATRSTTRKSKKNAEDLRNRDIRELFSKALGVTITEEPNPDRSMPDGIHAVEVQGPGSTRIRILKIELKRDIGEGGCDPTSQAGISLRRYWIDEGIKPVRDKCCCPTLMLAGGGPWLSVLGGVFTDKIIVQRLTDMMWLGYSTTHDDARVYRLARVLRAVRDAIHELESFYKAVITEDTIPEYNSALPHPRFYPYANFFIENDQRILFTYEKALEDDPRCVTYKARTTDAHDIVIKFVSKYGQHVHKFLADKGYAPEIRYFGLIPDDGKAFSIRAAENTHQHQLSFPAGRSVDLMYMVVMDYVDASSDVPATARTQLHDALFMLHSEGWVLGDLRKPNVLFDEEGKLQLIDFDWAGPFDLDERDEGLPDGLQEEIDNNKSRILTARTERKEGAYVCYPTGLNMVDNLGWASSVKEMAPIRPHHDWHFLDKF